MTVAASFDSQVVLITGGSSGIGRTAATAFAGRGAVVVIAARNEDRGEATAAAIRRTGGAATFLRCDVSDAGDVATLLERITARHGRLDVAFNCAGSENRTRRMTADYEEAEFDGVIAANLKSTWLCMRYELLQMTRQTPAGGAIVNAGSINALGGAPLSAAYSAAKAGVTALTKAAAHEYAAYGIRINVVIPGGIDTPMLDRAFRRMAGNDQRLTDEVATRFKSTVPLHRLGQASEVADAVLWLCSPASTYVTGHALVVDGGLTAAFR